MRDFTTSYRKMDLAAFIIPVIISELAQEVCSLISTGVISRYLSYEAVAVRGALSGYSSLQHYIFVDMMLGFGVYIMRCIGTKEKDRIARSFGGAAWFAIALGVLVALLGLFFTGPLLDLANVPTELQADAARYLRILLLGSGLVGIRNLFTVTIQGSGETVLLSILNAVSIVTHMLLIILLVAGLHVGVEAAALTLLINNAWQCVILFVQIARDPVLAPSLSLRIFTRKEERRTLLKNGFSKAGMTILVGIGGFFMQRALNTLPTELIAGYSYAAGTLNSFFMQPLGACATTAQVCAAQNFGSRNYPLMKLYVRKMIGLSVIFSLVCIAAAFCFGGQLLTLVAGKSIPAEVLRAGTLWLMLCTPVYPLLSLFFICRNCVQVTGGYRELLFFGFCEMTVSLLFAQFIVPVWGYTAVCLCVTAKWTLCGLLSYLAYRKRTEALHG